MLVTFSLLWTLEETTRGRLELTVHHGVDLHSKCPHLGDQAAGRWMLALSASSPSPFVLRLGIRIGLPTFSMGRLFPSTKHLWENLHKHMKRYASSMPYVCPNLIRLTVKSANHRQVWKLLETPRTTADHGRWGLWEAQRMWAPVLISNQVALGLQSLALLNCSSIVSGKPA